MLDISIDANVTFHEAAEAFIRAHEPEWRIRGNTLRTYAYPFIGNARVRDIDTAMTDSLAEEALAHIMISQTIAANRRRDQLERRRLMMEDWGAYLPLRICCAQALD